MSFYLIYLYCFCFFFVILCSVPCSFWACVKRSVLYFYRCQKTARGRDMTVGDNRPHGNRLQRCRRVLDVVQSPPPLALTLEHGSSCWSDTLAMFYAVFYQICARSEDTDGAVERISIVYDGLGGRGRGRGRGQRRGWRAFIARAISAR